ncbi:hypothetical protein [Actinopolyspora xinjiangensis]|uniref:hypothetical protein n=1 Tax=Actinopolyspora xinjiangensis TaxID=405564 RepID=UPI001113AD37|nr:hypothetical protein [Actinopolyspora xinjiangensis]
MRKIDLLGSLAAAAALFITSAGAATAQEAAHSESDSYCAIKLGKSEAGKESPVLARACSSESSADATAKMKAKLAEKSDSTDDVTVKASMAIMYWYEHKNFNRDKDGDMTVIYGDAGNCDSAGYRITPVSWWKNNLSSIFGNGDCGYADITNKAYTYTEQNVYVQYDYNTGIGRFDNNVGVIQIHS